jgi:hypothetical protein
MTWAPMSFRSAGGPGTNFPWIPHLESQSASPKVAHTIRWTTKGKAITQSGILMKLVNANFFSSFVCFISLH